MADGIQYRPTHNPTITKPVEASKGIEATPYKKPAASPSGISFRPTAEVRDTTPAPASTGVSATPYTKPASSTGIATPVDTAQEDRIKEMRTIGSSLEKNMGTQTNILNNEQGGGTPKPTPATTTGISLPVPEKVTGPDYTEIQKQLQDKQKQDIAKLETDRATNLRNVQNTFSHLYTQGKNNGFMNARNLAGVREANRSFEDLKTNLDNTFLRENLRLSEKGLESDARYTEMANTKWEQGISSRINALVESGNFEEAQALAKEASEVSPNGFFSAYSDPDVIQALIEEGDVEKASEWSSTFNAVNELATNVTEGDEFMKNETIAQMFAAMQANPIRSKLMMRNFFGTMNEDTYSELGITENDKRIIDEFNEGKREFNDLEVQRVFGNSYIKDINNLREASNSSSLLNEFGVTQAMRESGAGGEIVEEWLLKGADQGGLEIDVVEDPLYGGAGINEIRFMGDNYSDAEQLTNAPGIDAAFTDFNGNSITEKYTIEDARGDVVTIDGKEYNQGAMYDAYLANFKREQNEYGKMSDSERLLFGGATNMEEFKQGLKEFQRETGLGLNEYKNKLAGLKTVGEEGLTIEKEEFVDAEGDVQVKEDWWDALSEDEGEALENAISSGDINSMDKRTLDNILFQAGGDEGSRQLNSNAMNLLLDEGLMQEIDPTTPLKDGIFREEGTPFSSNTIQDTMRGMQYNESANRFEGYTMYEGMPYEVVLTPSHAERNGGDLSDPMVGVTLKRIGGGDEDDAINMKVRLQGVPVVKDDDVKAPASRVSNDRAIRWFKEFGGNL